ncbi:MAG: TonB-dependent receptor [Proteobacteria bacterium]|nr:TonB-dependent receptor [Pseudomonadota bacterium]
MRLTIVAAAASLSLISLAVADPAAAAMKLHTEIPAQGLDTALQQLMTLRDLHVVYVSEDLHDQSTGGASGDLTAAEALTALLSGTGLTYRYLDEQTVLIVPATTAQGGARTSSPAKEGKHVSSDTFRLAQAGTSTDVASVPLNSTSAAAPAATAESANLEQVVVTGTRIRGHDNPASQVYTITSKDIEEQGLLSTDDVFRSIPQVSGMGSMQAMDINNLAPGGSIGHSTVNLGGFGAKSTLVLINGRRTANSSVLFGDSVNVGTIPTSAIERVEVLPTAAAAIYGADAVGGVVNIILKKRSAFETNTRAAYEDSSNGGNATQVSQDLSFGWGSGRFTGVASYRKMDPVTSRSLGYTTQDFRSRGGYDLRSISFGETGIIDGLGSLPAGNSGTQFTPADVSPANIVPASQISQYATPELKDTAVYINAEQEVTASVRLFVDAIYSRNDASNYEWPLNLYSAVVPATNAFNPFGKPVAVTYQFDTERDAGSIPSTFRAANERLWQGTFGADISLPHDWQMQIYGSRAAEESLATYTWVQTSTAAVAAALADPNPQTALNLFGNGSAQNPATLRNLVSYWMGKPDNKITSNMSQFSAQADGALFDLPTGAVKASFVGEWRKDTLDWAGFGPNQPNGQRTAQALGAEFAVPLLNPATGQQLDMTLAARWDRYSASGDFNYDGIEDHMRSFSATTPMIGLAWKPLREIRLRASWNKAFRAPVVHDLAGINYAYETDVIDPLAPGGAKKVHVNVSYPASQDLGPERAKVWTAGIDWQHVDSAGNGLNTSLTYSDTRFSDRIIGAYTYFGQDPSYFVSHPDIFPGVTARDANGNLTDVYLRNINLAGQTSRVWSMDATYYFNLLAQHFTLGTSVAYTSRFDEQVDAAAALNDLVGTFRGPDRWRATLRAGWASPQETWAVNLFVRTSSSYTNTVPTSAILNPPAGSGSQIMEKVAGYTTVDLTGSYQYHAAHTWLDGLTVTGGARNLFDKTFPFIDNTAGHVEFFDASRVDVRGRVIFIEVGKKFR